MRKTYPLLIIVALLNLYFHEISCQETREESFPNYEYTQIFNGVPALFEYLLNAVEQKPEMLEKNDISMFKRTISIGKYDNDEERKRNTAEEGDSSCGTTQNNGSGRKTNDKRSAGNKEPPRTEAYEYGYSTVLRGLHKHSCKTEAGRNNIKLLTKINKLNNKEQKHKINHDDKEYSDYSDSSHEEYEDVDWDNENGYPGFQDLFGLDVQPEEIKEGSEWMANLLEDHNNKRMKG